MTQYKKRKSSLFDIFTIAAVSDIDNISPFNSQTSPSTASIEDSDADYESQTKIPKLSVAISHVLRSRSSFSYENLNLKDFGYVRSKSDDGTELQSLKNLPNEIAESSAKSDTFKAKVSKRKYVDYSLLSKYSKLCKLESLNDSRLFKLGLPITISNPQCIDESKISGLKGRPYSTSLHARFYIHESIEELFCYLSRCESFDYYLHSSFNNKQTYFKKITQVVPNMKNIIFNLSSEKDIEPKLCHAFSVDSFRFVKIIRNAYGNLVKLETINDSHIVKNSSWIKRNICYPRYKSQMKIHLIKLSSNINRSIYLDKKVFEVDSQINDNEVNNIKRSIKFIA